MRNVIACLFVICGACQWAVQAEEAPRLERRISDALELPTQLKKLKDAKNGVVISYKAALTGYEINDPDESTKWRYEYLFSGDRFAFRRSRIFDDGGEELHQILVYDGNVFQRLVGTRSLLTVSSSIKDVFEKDIYSFYSSFPALAPFMTAVLPESFSYHHVADEKFDDYRVETFKRSNARWKNGVLRYERGLWRFFLSQNGERIEIIGSRRKPEQEFDLVIEGHYELDGTVVIPTTMVEEYRNEYRGGTRVLRKNLILEKERSRILENALPDSSFEIPKNMVKFIHDLDVGVKVRSSR